MSDDIVSAAHIDTTNLEKRLLELKGKAEGFPAWIETVQPQEESHPDRT
jgi:hypothetical protein